MGFLAKFRGGADFQGGGSIFGVSGGQKRVIFRGLGRFSQNLQTSQMWDLTAFFRISYFLESADPGFFAIFRCPGPKKPLFSDFFVSGQKPVL